MFLRNLYRKLSGPTAAQKEVADNVNDQGFTLAQRGLFAEAVEKFNQAIDIDPKESSYWSNLGTAQRFLGDTESACRVFEKASKLKGAPALFFDNWGGALEDAGRLDESIEAHKKAIALDPTIPDLVSNLGNVYRAAGRLDDAAMNLDAAVSLAPNSRDISSSRLYGTNFLDHLSPEKIAEDHFSWPGASTVGHVAFKNSPEPDRILKIGYVSSDLRHHSCANFILPLLDCHDRGRVNVTAFSGVTNADAITDNCRVLSDDWVDTATFSDKKFFDAVQSRAIDILVDCNGHTGGNRLSSFLFRPAPVQISWLGYPNTTGLSAMDVKLTDAVATPADMAHLFSETLVPLPNGFHSYRPVKGVAAVTPLPMVKNGYPTFGAFHNLAKMSDRTLSLFSEVLRVVPNAHLLVKSKSFSDSGVRTSFENKCIKFGLDPQRVEARPWRPNVEDHFTDFSDIDIALDATPYNGTTTTCEALWMGVPVVTLCGDRPASRVSASLLTQIKHPEWIAEDDDEYVRIAAELVSDQNYLAQIRKTLRDDVLQSSLGDAQMFARSVEDAYRALWRDWCEKQASGSR